MKEKSDEEKEKEILELRRKLVENMNERRLLKKKQQQEQETINSNEKIKPSEVAAKKAESNTAAAVTNDAIMNENMSYFKKKLLEHEQVLSKSTSQSQQSNSTGNMNHTGTNKKIDRILIRIKPNDNDDGEDSYDESLSTDDDEEKTLTARKNAVLSSKLSTTKTLLQHNIGLFLEQAKRMALMANDQKQNTKPANNQVVTVNNEPTKQMTSQATLLNSNDITSEKDNESLIKELRDRINLKRLTIIKFIYRNINF